MYVCMYVYVYIYNIYISMHIIGFKYFKCAVNS